MTTNYAITSTPLIHGPNMMANFRRMSRVSGDFKNAIDCVASMLGDAIGLQTVVDYLTQDEQWMTRHTELSDDGEVLYIYPEGIPDLGSGVTQVCDTEDPNTEEK